MEASNAVKMLEDTIKLGKIGMPLLSKEGMENRLKMHEALQKGIEALEIVNKAEAVMPEKAKGKEGLHGEALRTSIRDTAVRNQAISDCLPAFAKLSMEKEDLEIALHSECEDKECQLNRANHAEDKVAKLIKEKENLEKMLDWVLPKDWKTRETAWLVKSEEHERVLKENKRLLEQLKKVSGEKEA